jgi:HTH-type transcriptional regulator, glycine betaine synthesis regulator
MTFPALVERRGLDGPRTLRPWEERALEAVGAVIAYWGFKNNHGRIWAFLYLRDEPHTAAEIQDQLKLSKGAVSMLLRELEQWDVLRRVRIPNEIADHFVANADFMPMIGRVLGNRESVLFQRVRDEIQAAEREAVQDPTVSKVALERLKRMRSLAVMMEQIIQLFMNSTKLDLTRIRALLQSLRREKKGQA